MQETEAPSRRPRTRGQSNHAAGLTCEERHTIEQGRLFRRLPPELQDAILGRAYVWRLKDGEQVLPENQDPDHWIGVASGELLGRTRSLENGQTIATHVLAPGVWLNVYSPLCGVRRRGIEFVASGPSCMLAVSRADMLDLCARWPELVSAMLSLSALNLRYAHLVLQETQSNTLEQKLLRWLDAAVRLDAANRDPSGWVYRSVVSQSAMASSAGVSRQSWNAGMARLEAAGVIQRMKDGLTVPDLARLEAAMKQHGLLGTSQYVRGEEQPAHPPAPLSTEPLPIESLRDDERAALRTSRWYERLGAEAREDLMSKMRVLRLPDKASIAVADRQPPGWVALLQGGMRLACPPRCARQDEASQAKPRSQPTGAILAQLQPGATFLEHALIDRGNCGVDVCCDGDSTLLLLEPDDFRSALAAHADFRLVVLKWLSFSHHQSGFLKLILTLPMPLRLHAWLDVLAYQRGQPDGAWLSISMALGQQEMAAWLSTTRQYVAKALNELENEGVLVRRRDTFLLRREALPLARPPMATAHC
ncbi:Crp/Fnr family transcriptional regulator [Ideonella sp. YS5]|uniref:Crp/Fnr family transcriptional regulator n=1 Tax=Ideonella sp. YS5 TaxID=3453714 RepID=UPI003EED18DA